MRKLIERERRLPDVDLPALAGAGAVPVRVRRRQAPILLLLHGPECRECMAYAQRLADCQSDLADWDARLLGVVLDSAGGGVAEISAPLTMAIDAEGRLASRLSLEVPAVVVADQWGEIHAAEEAGAEHRFLDPEELVEWAKY